MSRFHVLMMGVAGATAGALLTMPAAACVTDADCDEGLVCKTETYETDCAYEEDCPEGQTCEAPDCEPTIETYSYCDLPPCQTDADCGEGRICKIETYEIGCATAPCPEGEVCEEPACEPSTETYSYCMDKPCASDTDCAEGLICIQQTAQACSGGASVSCDDEGNCTTTELEENCTTETYSYCGYRYQAECTQNEDCGPGFDCVPEQICWCTGATGVGPTGEAGAASVPDEPIPVETECGCEPTGRNQCELQELPCAADTDCPEGFSCQEDGATACWFNSDGTSGCETPSLRCYPPGYLSESGEDGGWSTGGSTIGTGGSSSGNAGTGESDGTEPGTATGTSTGTVTGGPGLPQVGDDDDENAGHGGLPWGGCGDDRGCRPPAHDDSEKTGAHQCPFGGGKKRGAWPPKPPFDTPAPSDSGPETNAPADPPATSQPPDSAEPEYYGTAGAAPVSDVAAAMPMACSVASAGGGSAAGAAWIGLVGLAALLRRRRH